MKILAIETSCDETSAAVVEDGVKLLSNIIYSQIPCHAPFGGVVPEIAFRKHLENLIPVIEQALTYAELTLDEIDAVAVTSGPGLVGALLVGIQTAKGIALTKNIPLIPVNHIEGHIHAVFLEEAAVEFPFIALVVSGGHTHLYLVKGHGDYVCVGQTLDDAAGEAFDKVARMMGLGYPGGPAIDAAAKDGNVNIKFPRAIMKKGNFDFSFSGLKTAVQYHIKNNNVDVSSDTQDIKDIAASFQDAVADVLVRKTAAACRKEGVKNIVISGGVACNSLLRTRMREESEKLRGNFWHPSPVLCTDNAGMIGACGYFRFKLGNLAKSDLDARSRWPLTEMNRQA